jgi:hypothetical protein
MTSRPARPAQVVYAVSAQLCFQHTYELSSLAQRPVAPLPLLALPCVDRVGVLASGENEPAKLSHASTVRARRASVVREAKTLVPSEE